MGAFMELCRSPENTERAAQGVSLEKEARNIFGTPLTVAKWREQLQPRTAPAA
jgi:hypothetical protein